ncbi:LysR family transcriptional regulator, partial [Pseudomonas helleri]
MEIRQLKYFVAIIDCGSLSGAAREVFVAQSALSKQVLELEKELGVQLLHRSRNGVSATDPGKVFYEYAQGILKHLQDARVAVLDSAQTLSGSVVVALPQSVASPLALPLLRAVAARYPHISLNLNEELTGNLFEQLLYGRIDLALFTDVGLPADIAFSPLLQEDFYWLSAATDPQPPGTGALTLEQAL